MRGGSGMFDDCTQGPPNPYPARDGEKGQVGDQGRMGQDGAPGLVGLRGHIGDTPEGLKVIIYSIKKIGELTGAKQHSGRISLYFAKHSCISSYLGRLFHLFFGSLENFLEILKQNPQEMGEGKKLFFPKHVLKF